MDKKKIVDEQTKTSHDEIDEILDDEFDDELDGKPTESDETKKVESETFENKDENTKSVFESKRPEKYIPVEKYTSEKRKWKQQLDEKDKALQKLKDGDVSDISNIDTEKSIQDYAEKTGIDVDSVRELVNVVKGSLGVDPETIKEIKETSQKLAFEADRKAFNNEFESDILPAIKSKYPDVPQSVIDEVRDDLDKLSHTPTLKSTPLKYIFAGESDRYSKILGVKMQKSAETGAPKKTTGAISFAEISQLPEADKSRAIKNMTAEQYEKYIAWTIDNEGSGSIVTRDGKRIN